MGTLGTCVKPTRITPHTTAIAGSVGADDETSKKPHTSVEAETHGEMPIRSSQLVRVVTCRMVTRTLFNGVESIL